MNTHLFNITTPEPGSQCPTYSTQDSALSSQIPDLSSQNPAPASPTTSLKPYIVFFLILLLAGSTSAQPTGENPSLRLRGYIRAMPGLYLDQDFSDPSFYNSFHNRLNVRWNIANNVDLRIEGRNRLLYHELYGEIPAIEDLFSQDDALVDLSWLWLSDGGWIGHSEVDRLYLSWNKPGWRVRAGRQRVNWGINLVSNPNDLFNTYSFFDFDYEERPGTDAVRVQHFISRLSSVEIAVSPARNDRDMVAAARYSYNVRGYDLQAIGGYYRDRVALGGGWAGHIGGAGFKGELSWFYDLEETADVDRSNMVVAVGMDYMFPNGTFGMAEFLYNGGYGRTHEDVFLVTEPMRPDNIMFSEYAVTLNANHPFSPIFRGGMAVMVLPDIEAGFLMPELNYSLQRNLDIKVLAQIFIGGDDPVIDNAGSGLFAILQYAF